MSPIKKPNALITAIVVVVVIGALGISGFLIYQGQKEQEAKDQAAAQAKLDKMIADKEWAAKQAEQARQWAEEQAAEQEAQRQAEAAKPRYGAFRLQQAAKPRTWAPITVPEINCKLVLNSMWRDGRLYYRVAVLGHDHALHVFTSNFRQYRLTFMDQAGYGIFDHVIAPDEFVLDPPHVNQGIPTLETNGDVELDLPIYEHAVQWNLVWET
jgi:hypothetical protein